jgi:hypothetical protein
MFTAFIATVGTLVGNPPHRDESGVLITLNIARHRAHHRLHLGQHTSSPVLSTGPRSRTNPINSAADPDPHRPRTPKLRHQTPDHTTTACHSFRPQLLRHHPPDAWCRLAPLKLTDL